MKKVMLQVKHELTFHLYDNHPYIRVPNRKPTLQTRTRPGVVPRDIRFIIDQTKLGAYLIGTGLSMPGPN